MIDSVIKATKNLQNVPDADYHIDMDTGRELYRPKAQRKLFHATRYAAQAKKPFIGKNDNPRPVADRSPETPGWIRPTIGVSDSDMRFSRMFHAEDATGAAERAGKLRAEGIGRVRRDSIRPPEEQEWGPAGHEAAKRAVLGMADRRKKMRAATEAAITTPMGQRGKPMDPASVRFSSKVAPDFGPGAKGISAKDEFAGDISGGISSHDVSKFTKKSLVDIYKSGNPHDDEHDKKSAAKCSKCKTPLKPGAKKCQKCGTPTAKR